MISYLSNYYQKNNNKKKKKNKFFKNNNIKPSFPSLLEFSRPFSSPFIINVTNVGDYDAEDSVLGIFVLSRV